MTSISERQQAVVQKNESSEPLNALFPGKYVSPQEQTAISIIQIMEGLTPAQRQDIFFYHKWQKAPKLTQLRMKNLLSEAREDEASRMVSRIHNNELLYSAYNQFHDEYIKVTQHERTPMIKGLLEEGLSLEEAAEEAEIDLQLAKDVAAESLNQLFITRVKKGSTPSEAIRISGIEPTESRDLLLALLGKHPTVKEIFQLKEQGFKNSEIAEKLQKTLKYVDKITRAFVFLEIIPPHKSRVEEVKKQDDFMRKIMLFRNQGMGNYVISEKLDISLVKVEDAARFLVWTGLLDPISKRDALLQRYNKEDYKEQVRQIINKVVDLGNTPLISIIGLYRDSRIGIGYEKFLRLFHEIEKEQKVPRYYHRAERRKTKN